MVVLYPTDHPPLHVDVFEDGRRVLKFDVESWRATEGCLAPHAALAVRRLRAVGVFVA